VHSAAMRGGDRRSGDLRLLTGWAAGRSDKPSPKFFRLAHLRRLRGCEQVAAVCYRIRGGGIEFLLVRTRGGRWTFPKGRAEPGLTHAQAAALEAFEEAGVHGRMEEASFTRYFRRKPGDLRNSVRRSGEKQLAVSAHLCEVSRLDPPPEFGRNPTWFSPDKAKRCLREERTSEYGAELARVVDRALTRILRLRSGTGPVADLAEKEKPRKDGLQKVQFIDSGRRPTLKALGSGRQSTKN
jgi:8-oxo-dGTP pyrophosphatase MutT (NUDIX family)